MYVYGTFSFIFMSVVVMFVVEWPLLKIVF